MSKENKNNYDIFGLNEINKIHYKNNSSNNNSNENSTIIDKATEDYITQHNGDINTLLKKEKIYYIIIYIVGFIITVWFGLWFHKIFVKPQFKTVSVFLVILLPLIINTYHTLYNYNNNYNTYEEEKEKLLFLKQNGEKTERTIPAILFGVGLVYSRFRKSELLTIIFPYLIFGLFFGTIIPLIINHLILDKNDLEKLIIIEDLVYTFNTLAYGLITAAIIVPFIHYSIKYVM